MIYKEIKEKAMIDNVMEVAKEALTTKDYSGTWFSPLFRDNDNLYAVCFAYMDYENNDNYCLFGKIAMQPRNSIMQCDYDMDWNCPIDDKGDVIDTEISITECTFDNDIKWLLDTWNSFKKECIER